MIEVSGSVRGPGVTAELVITTAMSGYTEALTDPSYRGQILAFAYPQIGNYGLSVMESDAPTVAAAVFYECSPELHFWLIRRGVTVVTGADVRALKRYSGRLVTIPGDEEYHELRPATPHAQDANADVLVVDYGVKLSLLKALRAQGLKLQVIPSRDVTWEDLRVVRGIVLSSGPGDPASWPKLELPMSKPVLGVCLGFQLMMYWEGHAVRKMERGHRSNAHPVFDRLTQRAYVTAQNHGYEVPYWPLKEGWKPWFQSLEDESLEGALCADKPWRGVQFHPEGGPGPTDTAFVVEEFAKEILR